MTISSLLTTERVLFHPPAESKNLVIDALVGAVPEWDGATRESVHAAVLEREEIMSTGVGNGIAIPHAKVAKLTDASVCAAVLEKPVDFSAYDGKPVDLVFLVVGPDKRDSDHLKILSRLSRILGNARMAQRLRQCEGPEAFYRLIETEESQNG